MKSIKIIKTVIPVLLFSLLSACDSLSMDPSGIFPESEKPQDEGDVNNLNGSWSMQTLSQDPVTQNFVDLYTVVNIHDNGQNVILDNCQKNKKIYLTRQNGYLVTANNEALHILASDHLESVSISHIVKLSKLSESWREARGSFNLDTENLPSIKTSENICVQQTVYSTGDQISLQITVPYERDNLEIDLYVDDINDEPSNVDSMTFFSTAFGRYFKPRMLLTSSGNVTVHKLTATHINLEFDITTDGTNDRFTGNLNVTF